MPLIRYRQNVVTQLFPHNANRRYIVTGGNAKRLPAGGLGVRLSWEFEYHGGEAIEGFTASIIGPQQWTPPALSAPWRVWVLRGGVRVSIPVQGVTIESAKDLYLNVDDDDILPGDRAAVELEAPLSIEGGTVPARSWVVGVVP